MQVALRLAINGKTMIRATRLALVVGPILVLINQGDTIVAGNSPDWLKVALTFAVPYCVSTWTSVAKDLESVFDHHSKQQRGN
ncbi:hypothetical protein CWI75_13100 [Kineobactrum sediminis]|uniref:Phosphoenolpyruvate protein kinase n=1 Tax=Kineobactrum sediminis TaxID=1905677 RepID=A0A2N5Y0T6_9GAMM|nr:nitrate/nitrite transporter NrtS [Kineobactrum sediminis]PLW82015.1 hypothetical protein CWI75_13100 [Kineobactrum sediminis]